MTKRPYRLPRLFGEETSPPHTEMLCKSVIRETWKGNKGDAAGLSMLKAAREQIVSWSTTPSELEAMARWLFDFRSSVRRRLFTDVEKPVDWLQKGSGCTRRTGKLGDVCWPSSYALEAILAILVELPIENTEDAEVLLAILRDCKWSLPHSKRKRAAQRMARYVSDRILGEPFKPMVA